MCIKKIRTKKAGFYQKYEQCFSQTKNIQNIVKNTLQNKIKEIKKKTNLLQNILAQVQRERNHLKEG